ncbi:hypothetical protein HN784_01460 [bacterium]|jgi:pSer/pThr/pTyr-binding forkhead associated (FHA) protein|nr:hypothetical protein [bacterium]MBT4250934.1 hypothetical protein [bacterium]MBT4597878.1 hypothetical protein [bacterium]MBT6753930.1 hypothetical protein [bacterium]MBT7037359.1 hypothetical protein [bacterium]
MLDQILEKPESYRRNVAIFATFVVGVAVVSAWLLIAGYNVRQSTFALINSDNQQSGEFRNSLPSIRQNGDSVTTELSKQDMAASVNVIEKEKSLWDKFLGR